MAKLCWKVVTRSLTLAVLLPAIAALAADENPMDQEILLRIKQQLQSDIRLREMPLEIQVMAGHVTLQGELPSFFERSRLERICRRIEGVDKVTNRINIALVANTEPDLRRAVEQRMAADFLLRSSGIRVAVDGTIVTLTGTVSSLYERRRAEKVAEEVRGVSRVQNHVTLGTAAEPTEAFTDAQIAASIRATLGSDSRSLARPIEVSVQDGVVILEGEVDSHARRRFYRYLMERMPGVQQVENRLEVGFPGGRLDQKEISINDAALDVQLALNAARIVPTELHAHLSNDSIAIAGTVDSLTQKRTVIQLAQTFALGFPIIDEMEVAVDERVSASRQAELAQVFKTDVLLADAPIEVAIDQGVATLTGAVDRFADKLRAARLASAVKGIRAIDNQLVVQWMPTIADDALKLIIQQRLKRNRITSAASDSIEVTVDQGQIILVGQVASWEIYRQVAAIVSGTDGIRSIQNRLVVARSE